MDWSNEPWRKLYTRETPETASWPWQSRLLMPQLIARCDSAGQLGLGRAGVAGLADLLRVPIEVVQPGIDGLLADGCLTLSGQVLTLENFIEAQEARTSDRLRQEALRERRKLLKLHNGSSRDVTARHSSSRSEEIRREESREKKETHVGSADGVPLEFRVTFDDQGVPKGGTAIERLFCFWRKVCDHPQAKLDPKRQKLIGRALAPPPQGLGYPEDQLLQAIWGCANSPFHRGRNENHREYTSLDLILRDASHIDSMIHLTKPALAAQRSRF